MYCNYSLLWALRSVCGICTCSCNQVRCVCWNEMFVGCLISVPFLFLMFFLSKTRSAHVWKTLPEALFTKTSLNLIYADVQYMQHWIPVLCLNFTLVLIYNEWQWSSSEFIFTEGISFCLCVVKHEASANVFFFCSQLRQHLNPLIFAFFDLWKNCTAVMAGGSSAGVTSSSGSSRLSLEQFCTCQWVSVWLVFSSLCTLVMIYQRGPWRAGRAGTPTQWNHNSWMYASPRWSIRTGQKKGPEQWCVEAQSFVSLTAAAGWCAKENWASGPLNSGQRSVSM